MALANPLGYDIVDATNAWTAAGKVFATKTDNTVRSEADMATRAGQKWADTVSYALERTRQVFNGALQVPGPFIVDPAADAVAGDADTGADDLIIGNNSAATASGLTVLNTSGNGTIAFGDAVDNNAGQLYYSHAFDIMAVAAGGGDRLYVKSTAVYPAADNSYTLGESGNRWSNFFTMQGTVYGNLTLDTGTPNLILGDNSGSPQQQFRKSAAGAGLLQFMTGSSDSTNDKRLAHQSDETLALQHYNGAGWDTGMALTDGDTIDFPGSAGAPQITFGDGTGEPNIRIRKSAGDNGNIQFLSSGLRDWYIQNDGSEAFNIVRFVAGALQDTPLAIANATGDVTIANDLTLSGGDLFVSSQVAVGETSASFAGNAITWTGNNGHVVGYDVTTNATAKHSRLGVAHYTNASGVAAVISGDTDTGVNVVNVGGGYATWNAATSIAFWTAANSTTATGTERMSIDSAGDVTIANDLTLSGATSFLTVGDGTGTPTVGIHTKALAASEIRAESFNGTNNAVGLVAEDDSGGSGFIWSITDRRNNERVIQQASAGARGVTVTKDLTVSGSAVTFSGASAALKIGDDTGSPSIKTHKDTTGTANWQFIVENGAAGSWDFLHNTDETLNLRYYNGAGWDTGMALTDGDTITMLASASGTLTLTGGMDAATDVRARQCIADGDNAGIATANALTNGNDTDVAGAALQINNNTGDGLTHTGFIKFYVGTQAVKVPYFV